MTETVFDPEKKEWYGRDIELENFKLDPHQSLGSAILNSLELHAPKIAQVCANTGNTKTFYQLLIATKRTIKSLQNMGCGKDEVVLLMTDNTADSSVIIFAALYLGMHITAMQTFTPRLEYEQFLELSKPNWIFCDTDVFQLTKECLQNVNRGNTKIFTFDGSIDDSTSVQTLFESNPDADSAHIEPVEVKAFNQTAYILETSGTTGKPKFVRISHAAILDKMTRLRCVFGPSDVVLGFTNLDGVSGIRSLIGPVLNGSCRVVNQAPFSTRRYCDLVKRFKVTVSICGMTMATQIQNYLDGTPRPESDLSSVKLFCVGGTKVSFQLIQQLNKHLTGGRFCHNYGMTETVSIVAVNTNHSRNESAGQLVSGYRAKIVNEYGERLGVDAVGELCLKLQWPFLGYIGNDHNSDIAVDSEGFLMTGDLARFDEYNDLFIVDRKKEVFKCYGHHVSPAEIEEYLNEIEGVKSSCVVPIPDPCLDNLPSSLIVRTNNSKCSENSICDMVSDTFSFYKHLRGGIYFVDKLPVGGSGKVNRAMAKKMAIDFFNNRETIRQ